VKLHPSSQVASGYVIHGAIHKARPDVACVLHTHTRAGMAVAAMSCGLLPLSQTSIRFVGHIGYHDYEGPAIDVDERERLVRDLGPHDAIIMRNHGLLTCGATIQQAFNTMYQLEISCRSQVDAMAARTELTMPGENVLAHTAHLYQPGTRRPYGVLEWPAMLRLLAAQQKSSGYPPHWQQDGSCPNARPAAAGSAWSGWAASQECPQAARSPRSH
jgi:ribulose-5-phosphate 4-epimerase/fuculose-1-phosphate aldolase